MPKYETTVKYEERIDKYLGDNSNFSRSDIKKLIAGHAVFSNNIEVRKANFKVREGDILKVTDVIKKEINALPEDIKIDVVYEDEHIIVINKASGMVVHPAPGHPGGTLVNALLFRFKDLSDINGPIRPGIVHRIDKDTSGLLVVAKTNEAHQKLAEDLKDHKIERTYYALVKGRLEDKITHIDLPIGRDPKHRQRMCVIRENSKEAVTHVYVEKINEESTLVRCELETGRTHQIRVHLAYIKHPIIGDPLYGTKIDDFNQRLHAARLKLNHPITEKEMVFESKIPKEIRNS